MTPGKVTVRWLKTGDGYDRGDFRARGEWLPRLGPTAWLLLEDLHENLPGLVYDNPAIIDTEFLAKRYGVSAHVVWRAFQRLAGWRHGALEETLFTCPAKIRRPTPRELERGTRWSA